ncbi:helicase-like protein [Knoellia remsis]|uniref:Helicase-like protein n=1 Tax=Knoellia remsis TaxID=407159 RepID=A0A2T0V0H0_9MICO|nr:DEAD/DEAH box helicase [Knoellia remsis]PRY63680.1 helicase-like protein [Knoellia remsis]
MSPSSPQSSAPAHPLAQRALSSVTTDADELYAAFVEWAETSGVALYPHQDEAVIEVVSGRNVVLATPTGSGKSLVGVAAHFAALSGDRVSFYTAPIKALVNEKFFALCEVFGAENVGLLTGDASVNADAPIICCTAEVLANIALREGSSADVGLVVMDEFHYYADPQRGWAWQVPLLELPQAQFLLMSATLGDMTAISEDLERRTGREVAHVTTAERPVPLSFTWSLTPLAEMVEEIVSTHQAPVYVVHASQQAAAEYAASLTNLSLLTKEEKAAIAERLAPVRFAAGFGRTLSGLLRRGIGVHHAGLLPRYRRIVEQLAQAGLLKVIAGTDTLGVGINVPIRTVLFTGLVKFDGQRERVFRSREFHQIAGRAGRAGYDTSGSVVVQAPPHVIENERNLAKAGDDPKKLRKVQRRKPPEGTVVWTEQTFDKLVASEPEPLVSRMRIDNAMILNLMARPGDPVAAISRLVRDNHETPQGQARLARRAIRLGRSLLESGVIQRLPEAGPGGRTVDLTIDLPADFALNQPLAHFALAALDLLDPESPTHALDVVSVVEAVLDPPRPVLRAQERAARGERIAELKAEGVEYDERMALIEEVTHPQPLRELLEPAYETYRQTHPWLPDDALDPKSIVREMWEQAMGFGDLVRRYGLARSEGVVLRYLSDAWRTLRQTVPEAHHDEELDTIIEWLGETIRQTDSSLIDEWAALTDPEAVRNAAAAHGEAPPPPRPITANEKAFRAMVRQAMWRRVDLASRDDVDALTRLEADVAAAADDGRTVAMDEDAWDIALGDYWDEHGSIATDADARGPSLLQIEPARDAVPGLEDDGPQRIWRVRQILSDPVENRDWVIEAVADLDASDRTGELVLAATALRRL